MAQTTSKRQLRSSTTTAALDSETSTMPVAKKRKSETPRYLCLSCQTERTSGQFPDYNPATECEHLIHTCKACLKKWVEVQVESSAFVKKTVVVEAVDGMDIAIQKEDAEGGKQKSDPNDGKEGEKEVSKGLLFGVKCPHPDCNGVMRNVNVQMTATKKVHLQFVHFERKFIGDATPGWRWCLSAGCKAGQIHAPLLQKQEQEPKTVTEPPVKRAKKGKGKTKDQIVIYEDAPAPTEADICTCNSCGAQACVSCDRPYHAGETCVEFQARTKDRMDEEDKARREIEKATKGCPGCKKRIQKNGGCPNMYCSQCHANFCWNCAGLMERGRYCQCPGNRVPPEPQQQVTAA